VPPRKLSRHVVPASYFDRLAAGGGDEAEIRLLAAGEHSRRLLLLRELIARAAESGNSFGPLPPAKAAWNALTQLNQDAPAEFTDIITQPQVGMWMAHALRRLNGTASSASPIWVDIGYIYNIVLAGFVRAGVNYSTVLSHRNGTIMLPTLGMARLSERTDYGVVKAFTEGNVVHLYDCHQVIKVRPLETGESSSWWRLRRVRSIAAGHNLALWLDDIDPYREIGEPVPPDRLSDGQAERWTQLLDQAYSMLTEDNASLAASMTIGFKTLVPLLPAPPPAVRSASSGDSFGGALISLPRDGTMLAVTMTHEYQHIKLGALLHLIPLCENNGEEFFYAPWRDDPRPLSGLLQGVYAFAGVTEFWRRRRRHDLLDSERQLAEFEFALWRQQTWHAVQPLRGHASLTAAGRRFVDRMVEQMRTCWTEELEEKTISLVDTVAQDHRLEWRIRHLQPSPEQIVELAQRFDDGIPPTVPAGYVPELVPDLMASWPHHRLATVRLQLAGIPEELHSGALRLSTTGSVADHALISGNYTTAEEIFCELLLRNPHQPNAWAGLILAVAAQCDQAQYLLEYPELLPAIHRQLRAGPVRPDLHDLTRWLAGSRP
jgi:HEXXH motif-containing protein